MAENGYAKPVLVTSNWVAEHAGDDSVVVAEVDENPDLYEEGHIPGAVKLHWREDLQDPVERDVVGDKNNWFAAEAYWDLQVYGQNSGPILARGRPEWTCRRRGLKTDAPSP